MLRPNAVDLDVGPGHAGPVRGQSAALCLTPRGAASAWMSQHQAAALDPTRQAQHRTHRVASPRDVAGSRQERGALAQP